LQEVKDPATPLGGEAMAAQDLVEAVPIDRVKSLVKIQFEDNSGSISPVAAIEQISCVNKIVSDVPTKNKPSLIIAN
jgi:hypothetical protein